MNHPVRIGRGERGKGQAACPSTDCGAQRTVDRSAFAVFGSRSKGHCSGRNGGEVHERRSCTVFWWYGVLGRDTAMLPCDSGKALIFVSCCTSSGFGSRVG